MRPAVDWAIPHTSSNSTIHTNGWRLRSELTETQCIDVQFKGLEDIPANICTVVDTYIKPHTCHIMIKVNKSWRITRCETGKSHQKWFVIHRFRTCLKQHLQRRYKEYLKYILPPKGYHIRPYCPIRSVCTELTMIYFVAVVIDMTSPVTCVCYKKLFCVYIFVACMI